MSARPTAYTTLLSLRARPVSPAVDQADALDEDFDSASVLPGMTGLEALGFHLDHPTAANYASAAALEMVEQATPSDPELAELSADIRSVTAELEQSRAYPPVMSRRAGDRMTRQMAAEAELAALMAEPSQIVF